MASLPNMAERTVTIGGYSKTFSVTGWRIGYQHIHHPAGAADELGVVRDEPSEVYWLDSPLRAIFKAYDVRGLYGEQIDDEAA